MKEWSKPEIQELDISNTELNLESGWVEDGAVYNDDDPPQYQYPLYSKY